jgi:hypothetical protein
LPYTALTQEQIIVSKNPDPEDPALIPPGSGNRRISWEGDYFILQGN